MTTDTLTNTDISASMPRTRHSARVYAIRSHALSTARLRSNRARITQWLTELELPDVEALFDSIDGIRADNTGATARLVADHQNGCALATTILLGAKARMLAAVARSAPGDPKERTQVVLEAFLSRALVRVNPAHPYINQQLYWITLRSVTKTQAMRPLDQSGWEKGFDPNAIAGDDVAVDPDSYITAHVLLAWATERGVITDMDRTALELRFTGATTMRVHEVARRLGMPEDRLETRLRRAIRRLRDAAAEDSEDLYRAAVAARWAADQRPGVEKVGAAA